MSLKSHMHSLTDAHTDPVTQHGRFRSACGEGRKWELPKSHQRECQKRHSQDREMKGGQKPVISMVLVFAGRASKVHPRQLLLMTGHPNLREAKKGSADSQAIGNSIVNDAGRAAVGLLAGNHVSTSIICHARGAWDLSQNNRTLAEEIGTFINFWKGQCSNEKF